MYSDIFLSLASGLLYRIIKSYRLVVFGDEYLINCKQPPVFALFHAFQMIAAAYRTPFKTNILVSHSRDGELAARTLKRLGFGVVRGSSSRGGKEGLSQLIERVKKGESAAITVDGPKGPREVVKSGIVRLALTAGVPVVCVSAISKPFYRLKSSWDNFVVAPPFSKVYIQFSEPVSLEGEVTYENIVRYKVLIEERLKRLFEEVKKVASNT